MIPIVAMGKSTPTHRYTKPVVETCLVRVEREGLSYWEIKYENLIGQPTQQSKTLFPLLSDFHPQSFNLKDPSSLDLPFISSLRSLFVFHLYL